MDLILLSGNSINNKQWAFEVSTSLEDIFSSTVVQNYEHWDQNKELIDLDKEILNLVVNTKSLDNYVIFAKSAGCVLAIKGIFENKINPKKCIFVGLPLSWIKEHNFDLDTWIKDYSIPTLFIQQTSDPIGSFLDLKKYLESQRVRNYELADISGESHHYANLEEIKKLIEEFIK